MVETSGRFAILTSSSTSLLLPPFRSKNTAPQLLCGVVGVDGIDTLVGEMS